MYGVNLNCTSTYNFENIKCTAHKQTSRGSGLGWVIRLDLTVFFFLGMNACQTGLVMRHCKPYTSSEICVYSFTASASTLYI
jgi:hypothetical protein